jgi:hypothetical protein
LRDHLSTGMFSYTVLGRYRRVSTASSDMACPKGRPQGLRELKKPCRYSFGKCTYSVFSEPPPARHYVQKSRWVGHEWEWSGILDEGLIKKIGTFLELPRGPGKTGTTYATNKVGRPMFDTRASSCVRRSLFLQRSCEILASHFCSPDVAAQHFSKIKFCRSSTVAVK